MKSEVALSEVENGEKRKENAHCSMITPSIYLLVIKVVSNDPSRYSISHREMNAHPCMHHLFPMLNVKITCPNQQER